MEELEQEQLNPRQTLAAWLEADRKRVDYPELEGRTINLMGDSYLAGNGLDPDCVWPSLLGEKYGMTVENRGINGSTLSDFVTTNHPMVDRLDTLPDNHPDIVILEGGRNDYNQCVPLGTDQPDDLDTRTVKGALRKIIGQMRQRYPGAVLICITVWEVGGKPNAAGYTCSDYGQAMLSVCRQLGVRCINAMDSEHIGVHMTDPDFRAEYCMKPNDVSHLNADGMRLVFPVFERAIAECCAEAGNEDHAPAVGGFPF